MSAPLSLQEFRRRSALRLWQRFHIRLTALYGGVVFVLLGAMAGFFHVRAVRAESTGLRERLKLAAVATAAAIPPREVERLLQPADRESAEFSALTARLKRIADAEPEISAISVLRRTDHDGTLAFVADHVARGNAPAAQPGQLYVANRAKEELRGFDGPVVEAEPYTDEWGTQLSGFAPVLDKSGHAVAIVAVDVLADRLVALQRHLTMITIATFAVAAALLALLAVLVGRWVQGPLAQIVDATTAIAAGDLKTRSGLVRDDEFGIVGRHFDQMAIGLEEREFIKSTFGSYVSPELVHEILAKRRGALEGQRRRVAVLFCDVRGFTSLSEKLAPEEVVRVLNSWLERATQVVVARGGHVDKFIGDAVMAVWGSLDDVDDPAGRALNAAVELQHAITVLNREMANGHPLAVGVGVNVGDAVAGSIGSSRKLEFTVIGDTVNIASRFEGLCKLYGAQVVAAQHVVAASKNPPATRWLDRPIVQGREEPLDLVGALQPDDPRVQRLPVWRRGVEHLLSCRFAEARVAFVEASEGLDDPPARFQIARCDELIAHPPGAGWTPAIKRSK